MNRMLNKLPLLLPSHVLKMGGGGEGKKISYI